MASNRQELIRKMIVDLRKQQKLRQSDVAKMTGLQASIISKIEIGQRQISLDDLEKISAALNVPMEAFFISKRPEDAIYYKGYHILTNLKSTDKVTEQLAKQTKENLIFFSTLEL